MTERIRRIGAAVAAIGLLSPVTAEASQNWHSLQSPLTVSYNGVRQGQGYGYWDPYKPSSGEPTFYALGYLRDLVPGNESIYYQVHNTTMRCAPTCEFPKTGDRQSTRWNGSHWLDWPVSGDLPGGRAETHAKADIKVCVDRALRPDSCSSWWAGRLEAM